MEIKILEWINANLHGSHFVNFVMKCISYLAEWGWCCCVLSAQENVDLFSSADMVRWWLSTISS